ncbi:endocuticle structural glycoprotein SgAbd-8-like [Diorhabda sublineata]|uniref:endocuticle structural glycoprotein SgAbd-8-like n=1 Tax=Diorhabda sublineata TaxID=1163346 RepID=UPI0024E0D10A|nr:endocuticle structural glycoprotein SgAbd-8-like [Diorhabda sublineata]
MNYSPVIVLTLSLILSCQCQRQYQQQSPEYSQENAYNLQNTPPPPQILSHKQALNHDGNFKYVFTSDNGLAQGESISPDGSRNGGYSYIDPNGKKISVKYTAGKEGFRILEADHLPKAPQPIAPLPVQQPAYQPQYSVNQPEDDGQYRPEVYERAQQEIHSAPYTRSSYPVPLSAKSAPSSDALQEKEYFDEPGKPHSFGSGYIFEFGG